MYKKFHIYATFAICIPIHRGFHKQDTDPFEAGVLFVIFRLDYSHSMVAFGFGERS